MEPDDTDDIFGIQHTGAAGINPWVDKTYETCSGPRADTLNLFKMLTADGGLTGHSNKCFGNTIADILDPKFKAEPVEPQQNIIKGTELA